MPAEKIGLLIDVYNVRDVECDQGVRITKYNEYIDKYTISQNLDIILVQVISIQINLNILHNDSEFIIMVAYWSKDLDFDFQFWTIDPIEMKITCEDQFDYQNTLFDDELKRICKK